MNPQFVYDKVSKFYIAANKDAIALAAILSKIRITESDIQWIRSKGHIPRLTDGTEIGKVDVKL